MGAKSVAITQNLSANLLVRHLLAGGGPQESAFQKFSAKISEVYLEESLNLGCFEVSPKETFLMKGFLDEIKMG